MGDHHAMVNAPMYFARYDNRVPDKQLLGEIKHAVENHGVKIAVLDNLNFFMEVKRASDQILEMDRVIHEAIIFCKQVDVHLIVVMHPKKTESRRVESEFDIKGSSTAVQEAHNVLLFNRPSKEWIEKRVEGFPEDEQVTEVHRQMRFRELKIAKCRRRGIATLRTVWFDCIDGVTYEEADSDENRELRRYLLDLRRRTDARIRSA